MKPRLWTLSYDIGEPRRLQRVARVALAHGDRVQKSLYLCALDHDAVGALQQRLNVMLDAEADRADGSRRRRATHRPRRARIRGSSRRAS